jgi:predicted DNA-binding mobile mystery protein A
MRRDLARKHLDQRLAQWRPTSNLACPPRGWIRAIREAIGMTAAQLALRLNVSKPRVSAMEKGEVNSTLTLETINRIAEAMNCTFVYALVPNTPLESMVMEQAQKKVAERLARVDHTMKLEAQGLSDAEIAGERDRIIQEILKGNLRGLWDEV